MTWHDFMTSWFYGMAWFYDIMSIDKLCQWVIFYDTCHFMMYRFMSMNHFMMSMDHFLMSMGPFLCVNGSIFMCQWVNFYVSMHQFLCVNTSIFHHFMTQKSINLSKFYHLSINFSWILLNFLFNHSKFYNFMS
jgi:hypothetical protein